jgi:hypothetical protein
VLDSEGKRVWRDGRFRMMDNQVSILVPEVVKVTHFEMTKMSLQVQPTPGLPMTQNIFPHSAEIMVRILDIPPGEQAPQVREKMLTEVFQRVQGIKWEETEPLEVGGRTWARAKIFQGKGPQGGSLGYGLGAVTLIGKRAYALVLWGVSPSQEASPIEPLTKRFENLVNSARFSGEEDF